MQKITRTLLTCLITAILLASIGGFSWCMHAHARLLSVQTDSMRPTFRPGDAILVRPISAASLRLGEIINYQSPRNAEVSISHRLQRVDPASGWLTTKGDHLPQTDPSFPPARLRGQVIAIFPRLGLVIDTIKQPVGLALAVYLPAAFIVVAETVYFTRRCAGYYYSEHAPQKHSKRNLLRRHYRPVLQRVV